jgi:hypothetical protein
MDENSMDPIPYNTIDVGEAAPADVLLTADGRKFLNQTRPWVRFMSIMVFIGAGFAALCGLSMFLLEATGDMVATKNEAFLGVPGGGFLLGLLYLVLAVVYIAPGIFLSRYATAIKALDSTQTSQALEKALKYQKSFWRYVGILTVISLIVLAAIIAFSLAITFFMLLNK